MAEPSIIEIMAAQEAQTEELHCVRAAALSIGKLVLWLVAWNLLLTVAVAGLVLL